jgi:hypothetical protein
MSKCDFMASRYDPDYLEILKSSKRSDSPFNY